MCKINCVFLVTDTRLLYLHPCRLIGRDSLSDAEERVDAAWQCHKAKIKSGIIPADNQVWKRKCESSSKDRKQAQARKDVL